MSRLHTLFAAVPVLFAGGVLLGSAPSRADAGHHVGYWPSSDATIVAQVDPTPPRPPHPPMPPRPMHGPHSGSDISVTIHDGKVQIDGIKGMVDGRIAQALEAVRNMPDVPPDVRARLVKRLEKVQRSLDKRLSHLDINDMDQLGDELGKMGDEIGREMDEFGKEMEKYGKDMGKSFGKKFGKNFFGHGQVHSHSHDSDSDSDTDSDFDSASTSSDSDDSDDSDAADLGDLSLRPQQRDALQRLRADSERQVAAAKQNLDRASANLRAQLDNPASADADISRAVDAVAQHEATIRKARLLAWHNARRVLDETQRAQVMQAAAKKSR